MSLEIVLILIIAALIGGAVLWHFFHAKAAIELAKLEGRLSALEGKAKADVAALPNVPAPPAPPAQPQA